MAAAKVQGHYLQVMEDHGIVNNRTNIMAAFDHVGANEAVGFTLAAVCSLVVDESGGRNVWGDDPWNGRAYPKGIALDPAWNLNEKPVTEDDYARYKIRRNSGMQPQGCNITQLTSASLQIDAENAGGCWKPLPACIVGFQFLKDLFIDHGSALAGFTAYNGSGVAADEYGQRAVALTAQIQTDFNKGVE